MDRTERLATSVTPEQKLEFRIAAERRDKSQADLLRELVENFLDGEEIPEDVRDFFKEEVFGEGNSQTATAIAN